ncbi:phosphotransferase family protein [Bradyrhizobium liaoningense]|uniref:choline/ethanolamine kinase family protein n=1 Tax=Bradyrhizobium liaoningense TaxID=43992 RepID=UPI001BA4910E|nr:choline/ethanolamine kinase family protein [Bradyrhizobium liaoningense]MBR0740643.1 phosphotransferase family protein [Bradyrhizobium liaoningense]
MSGAVLIEPEIELERQLDAIPAWRGRTKTFDRIQAGITNLNWFVRLKGEDKRYFAKMPGPNTDVFIDRELAHEAARKAADTGYAPGIVHVADDGAVEVHEVLEGFRSCNVGDLLDGEVRRNIAEAYRVIHSTQSLSRTKTGFEQLRERLAQVRHYGGRLPKDVDYLLWQTGRAEQAINAAGMNLCMCFNDAYVTNYMIDCDRNVRIIDWEYASNNDPYWDLAMFAGETFLDGRALQELIEVHDGTWTPEAAARVSLYAGVGLLTWGFWAALQAKISVIPFDFAKYSELLMMRVRAQMASPRWEEALLEL